MSDDSVARPRDFDLGPEGAESSAREPVVPWTTLTDDHVDPGDDMKVLSMSRVLLQVGIAAVIVIALVVAGSVVVARQTAEREAINGASQVTDLLARAVVRPSLRDSLLSDSPAAARAVLDAAATRQVLGPSIVRLKLWTPQGRVIYSDEKRLLGRTFPIQQELTEIIGSRQIVAGISDVSDPENEFERGHGKLLEVHTSVGTPSGQMLILETYTRYSAVDARTIQLWRGFSSLVVSSLLLLALLLLPLVWTLLHRLRRGQTVRESLLQHAVDASAQERQRIAGTLHDGVVQDLAAISFAVTAVAEQADADGQPQLAGPLRAAAMAARSTIGGLRSLLVDIYPPSLATAGLVIALDDLASPLRSRGIDVRLDLPPADHPTGLDAAGEQLVFRVAQECLRNAARHGAVRTVELLLSSQMGVVTLDIVDDGLGFDMAATLARSKKGHFGLRLLPDLASRAGATLRLATAPGAGTRWRLEIPAAPRP